MNKMELTFTQINKGAIYNLLCYNAEKDQYYVVNNL